MIRVGTYVKLKRENMGRTKFKFVKSFKSGLSYYDIKKTYFDDWHRVTMFVPETYPKDTGFFVMSFFGTRCFRVSSEDLIIKGGENDI